MMYPYMTLSDNTEVVHSEVISEGGIEKVIVHFERPTDNGFDSARCVLPTYEWESWEGAFTEAEKKSFEDFLANNAALLYRYAAQGGIQVA